MADHAKLRQEAKLLQRYRATAMWVSFWRHVTGTRNHSSTTIFLVRKLQ